MIAVILAGGEELSEETHNKPKPMVCYFWHIMKIYASHNIRFIICCGYKQNKIKLNMKKNKVESKISKYWS